MNLRIAFGRLLIHLGAFLQSLPVNVMKPDDLIEFSRRTYAKPDDVESWVEDELVDAGLNEDERKLLGLLPVQSGKLLLLGVGGGREAIPLAQVGFQVTGVDFVPDMVSRAVENAERRDVAMEGLVQEISDLDVPAEAYDVVWISRAMYSCVPTQARRVAMVRKIAEALKPGGYFVCQYHHETRYNPSPAKLFLRRLVGILTLGNFHYEPGDTLWFNIEFVHAFSSEDEVRSELEQGGLAVEVFPAGMHPIQRGVICRKPAA
jgi:SAM-dependent methyltransferase